MGRINPERRAHPEVLEARWQIYANLEKWEGALDLAQALVKLRPAEPEGWIYTASSLGELGRKEEAHKTLLDAAKKFPGHVIICYDLACLSCDLKRLGEARDWLARAIDLGGNKIKAKALEDPDLELLWKEIGRI